MMKFQGKVALVTGGATGIGRAAALAFAREGAKVVVGDINENVGEETVQRIQQMGGEALFIPADVSKGSIVSKMIDQIIMEYGHLDYAFNNAGIGKAGTTVDTSEELWQETIQLNLTGVWLCMKYEIPAMLKNGGGAIVNAASAYGLVGGGPAAYVASKHGVVGLTKTAAIEYAQQNIRVNAVCPGFVDTPMLTPFFVDPATREQIIGYHPMGRIAQPDEIAESVLWLCSDAASFVTGLAMAVDGGLVAQ